MKIIVVLFVLLLIAGLVGGAIEYRPQIAAWYKNFAGITENTPETIAEYQALFNQYRIDHGVKPLEFKADLNKVATLRVEEIKIDFSHNSAGRVADHLAENIVEGIHSNSQALDCWDDSPGHQYNMLNSEYLYTGYAISHGYAVQVFSSESTVDGVPQLPPGYHWPGK